MNSEEKRLLFKTLLYLVGSVSRPNAGFTELIKDLRFQVNKCGKPDCGNGGEHIHLTQQEGKE